MSATRHFTCLRTASRRTGRLAGLFLVFITLPATASTQTPLDEVVVTARKVSESVQDVPMSVSVLPADILDAVNLSHLSELQFNVPGLVVNNLGMNGAGFSLRGIADQGGSSLSVAAYLNSVYQGNSNLAITRMFDVERIEVLRGPQGTLYGRNATGGSINFISRPASGDFSADVEVAYGSFDTARAEGHINIPAENAAFRFAYTASEGDGFIRNSVDDREFAENDFWGARGSLLLEIGDRVRIDFVVQYVEDVGASNDLWLPRPDHLADPSDIRLTTVRVPNPFLTIRNESVSVGLDYDLGTTTLRAISGYAKNAVRDVDDCAGTDFLAGCVRSLLPAEHRQWSQELQWIFKGNTSYDWLVGSYFYHFDAFRNTFQFTPVFDPGPSINRYESSGGNAYAVFAQATWHLTRQWHLTGGLRLSKEDQDLSTIGTGTRDSPTLVSAAIGENNESWRMDLGYDVTDSILLYAGVSTGFKNGGLTILPGGLIDAFGPENLTAYEVGFKVQGPSRRSTLNGAGFYYDFRDLQVSTVTVTQNGPEFETDNAAKAELYGVDIEGNMQFGDRAKLSAGAVWLPKREFVEYRNDQTGDTLSGNKLTRAPEWTLSAAIDYEHRLARNGKLIARIEYNYRSGFFYTIDNDPDFSQGSFALLNAFVRFEAANEKWYLFASGRNLSDVDYFDQVFLQSSPGYPDTYEIGFGYRY